MLIRHSLLTICSSFLILVGYSQDIKITSPNKQLQVIISVTDDKPAYSVTYKDKVMLEFSLTRNI